MIGDGNVGGVFREFSLREQKASVAGFGIAGKINHVGKIFKHTDTAKV